MFGFAGIARNEILEVVRLYSRVVIQNHEENVIFFAFRRGCGEDCEPLEIPRQLQWKLIDIDTSTHCELVSSSGKGMVC